MIKNNGKHFIIDTPEKQIEADKKVDSAAPAGAVKSAYGTNRKINLFCRSGEGI